MRRKLPLLRSKMNERAESSHFFAEARGPRTQFAASAVIHGAFMTVRQSSTQNDNQLTSTLEA